jgi:ferredoxin
METPCIVNLICELYAPSVFTPKNFENGLLSWWLVKEILKFIFQNVNVAAVEIGSG